jgi:N-acetylmuramoyl-L-alanine amidase
MKISGHRLQNDDGVAFPFVQSPNGGGPLEPRWLVMHYTADGGGTAVDWFKNPASKASAHLVISRTGKITQMMPFDRVANHAGKSEWKGVSGLNRHAIGIEMVNFGEVFRHPARGWMRYWKINGVFRWLDPVIPESELMLDGETSPDRQRRPRAWQRYTDAQVAAACEAARTIVAEYELEDVLGHEEISPGRKVDPGPAFGIAKFRDRVMRREPAPRFIITTTLNIHAGPALTHPTVAGSPLPLNTEVEVLEDQGGWKRVAVRGPNGAIGWVPTIFLKAAEVPAGGDG